MGATVVGMSHSDKKRATAFELGCDDYINTEVVEDMEKYKHKLTHILCTGTGQDFQCKFTVLFLKKIVAFKYLYYILGERFLELLFVNGKFMNVSVPTWKFPEMSPFALIVNQASVSGSAAGSPAEMREMIEFAAKKNIKPWITKYKMSDVNTAIEAFRAGKPRFRFVLENE